MTRSKLSCSNAYVTTSRAQDPGISPPFYNIMGGERTPNYDDMEPALAEAAREQAPQTAHIIRQLGAFESLKFVRVSPIGMDIYLGTFAHGQAEFTIAPLDANGKVVGRGWRVLP